MDKEQVLQLIRSENEKNYISGNPRIPPHTHNGVDNLLIPASSVVGLPSGGFSGMQVFTSSGTFDVPTGFDSFYVRMVGGGQGGGRTTSSTSVAAPGAAADYVESLVELTGQSTVTVTIGAAGAGRTSGSGAGADGGDTSFGSYAIAKGGNSSTTSVGDIVIPGYTAPVPSLVLFGAGSTTNSSQISQAGGYTPFGPGGAAALGPIGGANNGNSGQGYGSGGSGGASGSAGGAADGGDGKIGILIIMW